MVLYSLVLGNFLNSSMNVPNICIGNKGIHTFGHNWWLWANYAYFFKMEFEFIIFDHFETL